MDMMKTLYLACLLIFFSGCSTQDRSNIVCDFSNSASDSKNKNDGNKEASKKDQLNENIANGIFNVLIQSMSPKKDHCTRSSQYRIK